MTDNTVTLQELEERLNEVNKILLAAAKKTNNCIMTKTIFIAMFNTKTLLDGIMKEYKKPKPDTTTIQYVIKNTPTPLHILFDYAFQANQDDSTRTELTQMLTTYIPKIANKDS